MRTSLVARAAVLAAVLAVVVLVALIVSRAQCFSLTGSVVCRVTISESLVALSFDDGPTQAGVEHAIRELERFDSKATFFLIGQMAKQRPELVRALVSAGHEVGNHSYRHKPMIGRSVRVYSEEIARTDRVLRQAGVSNPQLFRPPWGMKLTGLPRSVEREGYKMITWDVDEPPGSLTAEEYSRRIVEQVRPGSIMLMHIMYPGNQTERDALPLVLKKLQVKGYKVVTVGELLRRSEEGR